MTAREKELSNALINKQLKPIASDVRGGVEKLIIKNQKKNEKNYFTYIYYD